MTSLVHLKESSASVTCFCVLLSSAEVASSKTRISGSWYRGGNGISAITYAEDLKAAYLWNWISPEGGKMYYSGVFTEPVRVTKLSTGEEIDFSYTNDHRIELRGLHVEEGELRLIFEYCSNILMA